MKATMSKDGVMRFDVRMTRRIGLDAMIEGIGWSLMRSDRDWSESENKAMAVESELKAFRSRKKIMDAATKAIYHDGDAVWTWADDCSFSEIIREQARVLIFKKFPELRVDSKSVSDKFIA